MATSTDITTMPPNSLGDGGTQATENSENAAPFRVVIPAHNEEAVILNCLAAMTDDIQISHKMEIVVVANGCTDKTAELARSFGGRVRTIETDVPSKANAINLGMHGIRRMPCLVVDADVRCSSAALDATASALMQDDVAAASPQLRIDLSHSSSWVRSYYKVWKSLPYAQDRLIGGGVYGLSFEAIEKLCPIPEVVADDLYVRSQFQREKRRTVTKGFNGEDVFVEMYPPLTLLNLLGIEARRWRGTRDLRSRFTSSYPVARNGLRALLTRIGRGYDLKDLRRYAIVKLLGRAIGLYQLTVGSAGWTKDLSTRVTR